MANDNKWQSINAGLSGLAGIVGGARNNIQNNEGAISSIENDISNTNNARFNFETFDTAQNYFNNNKLLGSYSSRDIDIPVGERIGNTLNSTISGVTAGGSIGGSYGAVIGGAIGLASGIGSSIWGANKAKEKAQKLNIQAQDANKQYLNNFANNVGNISTNMFNKASLNIAAYGGKLTDPNTWDTYTKAAVKKALHKGNNMSRSKYIGNAFAYGGDLSLTGDFSNGVTVINEGGTHESNPYDGIQVGVDQQGVPNLVEEGEVIYNDYVFSNRLKPTNKQLKDVNLKDKYKGKKYAEIAKDIQKESQERPNDPISKNTLDDGLLKLQTIQEETREKKEQANFVREFNKLTPEEQQIVTQDLQNQAVQQLQQEQPQLQQEPQGYQPTSATSNIQAEMAQSDPYLTTGEESYACGGKVNKFADAGPIDKNRSYKANWNNNAWKYIDKPTELLYQKLLAIDQNSELSQDDKNAQIADMIAKANHIQNLYAEASRKFIQDKDSSSLEYDPLYEELQRAFADLGLNEAFPENMVKAGITGDNYNKYTPDGLFGQITAMRNVGIDSDPLGLTDKEEYANWYKNLTDNLNTLVDKYGYEYTARALNDNGELGSNGVAADIFSGTFDKNNPENNSSLAFLKKKLPDSPIDKVDLNLFNNLIRPISKQSAGTPDLSNLDLTPDESEVDEGDLPTINNSKKPLNTFSRYAPAIGSSIQALTDAFGLTNRYDYTNPNMIARARSQFNPMTASYIGDYLTYNPFDTAYQQQKVYNQNLGTQRSILNSASGNRGAAMAGLLALNNQATSQSGDLYRQALDYNNAQRQRVSEFNRGTNQFNAQSNNNANQVNFGLNSLNLDAAYREAMMRDNMESAVSQARSANITNALNNLGNIGRENFFFNQANSNDALKYFSRLNGISGYKRGCGGKLKKK